jgi:hypothetical protein
MANGGNSGSCSTSSKMYQGDEGNGDAGKACWLVVGGVCDGRSQRSCLDEMSDCASYRLYDYVCNQERQKLENSGNLLKKLHTEPLQSTIQTD